MSPQAKPPKVSEYLVLEGQGLNLKDGDRREAGQRVSASDLGAGNVSWMVDDGVIGPLGDFATAPAVELADKHDVDLTQITGSGDDGKITKPDVEAAIEAAKK